MVKEIAHTIISNLLEMYLEEDIAEILKDKYPHLSKDIDRMNEAGLRGGFLRWAVKRLRVGEDVEELVDTVLEFQKRKRKLKKRDIFQYKSVEELQKAVEASYKNKITTPVKKDGYDILYDDGNYTVAYPKTTQASCQLGSGTKWCISATEAKNYFVDYRKNNRHIYLIKSKKHRGRHGKISIALESDGKIFEIADATNTRMFPFDLITLWGQRSYDNMISVMRKDASGRPDTLEYRLYRGKATEEELRKALEIFKETEDVEYLEIALRSNTSLSFLRDVVDIVESKLEGSDDYLGVLSEIFTYEDEGLQKRIISMSNSKLRGYLLNRIKSSFIPTPGAIVSLLKKLKHSRATELWITLSRHADYVDIPKEAFDLMVKDIPDLSYGRWKSLLKHPNFDHYGELIDGAINNNDTVLMLVLADRPEYVDEAIEYMRGVDDEDKVRIASETLSHIDSPKFIRAMYEMLASIGSNMAKSALSRLVKNPNTPTDILLELYEDDYIKSPMRFNRYNAFEEIILEDGPESFPKEVLLKVLTDATGGMWGNLLSAWEEQLPREAYDILVSGDLPVMSSASWAVVLRHIDDLSWLRGKPYVDNSSAWYAVTISKNESLLREAYNIALESDDLTQLRVSKLLSRNSNTPDDVLERIGQNEVLRKEKRLREKIESWDMQDARELADLLNEWKSLAGGTRPLPHMDLYIPSAIPVRRVENQDEYSEFFPIVFAQDGASVVYYEEGFEAGTYGVERNVWSIR